MVGAELGDEVGGVFGGVDSEGAGDDEEGLGEFADGKLFAGALCCERLDFIWKSRGLRENVQLSWRILRGKCAELSLRHRLRGRYYRFRGFA